jgi:hypothetical protein
MSMSMAAEILETLESLGVAVEVIGPDRLRLQPASNIPPNLVPRIREAKPEILEALQRRRVISSEETRAEVGKAISCRYDWQPGYWGLRLHCVAHHHPTGTATVFRMTSCGHDVLLEMAESGILTGQPLDDSQRVN